MDRAWRQSMDDAVRSQIEQQAELLAGEQRIDAITAKLRATLDAVSDDEQRALIEMVLELVGANQIASQRLLSHESLITDVWSAVAQLHERVEQLAARLGDDDPGF